MLEISGLSKSFGGFRAVTDVSLTVETRQIAAVIGPNGAGKSTLFNLITGHLRAGQRQGAAGRPRHHRRAAIPHLSPRRRPLVPAHQHLSQADGVENLQAAFIIHHRRGPNFWARSDTLYRDEAIALLRSIGLDGQENTVAGTLSYGNQKQVELGLALASDPRVLLLDEPTAGMSAGETHETISLLQRIAAERALTLLFTEHDMAVVFGIAQKIAVLHQGRKLAEGTPEAVRANPEVRRVYLGEHA